MPPPSPALRTRLTEAEDAALRRLLEGSGLSPGRWVRGAILAATADPALARLISGAAPPDGRGGTRAGAGRPRSDSRH